MKNNIPVEKNKEYILEITGTGFKGEGVAKVENYTIFVPEALEGEKVKVRIVKVNKNFGFGKLIDFEVKSKDRVEPICSIYNKCGGCQLQHYSYHKQLDFKRQRVVDAVKRIGKIDIKDEDIKETIGMEDPYRYRNKVQMPVREEGGKIKIGFYKSRSHDVVEVKECFIQEKVADKAIHVIKEWMEKYNISAYNEKKNKGLLKHIMVRKAFKNNDETMIVLVTNSKTIPYKDELIESIRENIPTITSIIHNINTKNTNVILGQKCVTLWRKDYITDYIGKFKFNISPLSFFQVNPIQTEVLYNKALEFADLKGNELVFDAYCGTGTISLFLSENCREVYGVEIIKEAIDNAKINAKQNNIHNAKFIVGKSEEEIPKLIDQGKLPDVIVVDPPRKGCDEKLLKSISKTNASKIVYVSCDPGTLARDLGLLNELGYNTKKVQPVDMFPMAAHIENVVLLTKK